jgi:hypothetical protein
MNLATFKQPKSAPIFECIVCDYKCIRNSEWQRHISTVKHRSRVTSNSLETNQQHVCFNCNKKYQDRTGLWRHNKKCLPKKPDDEKKAPQINELFDKETLIIQLLKQNQELQKSLIELSKNPVNITTNNNNTNNSHNKTFNLQFFLNEECKDALNISEFVSSIRVELEDLETTGRLGYVEGVSRIINKNLNDLDQSKRPIHCSDLKREVLYIKNDDQWTKEDETRPILKKAIKQVANENIKQIGEWRKKYPDCMDSDSRKNDTYLKIVSNSMSGLTSEEQSKNINKIVTNVAKETVIDK